MRASVISIRRPSKWSASFSCYLPVSILRRTIWRFPVARYALISRIRKPAGFCSSCGSGLFIALYLYRHGVYPTYLEALRYASFNLVSIATTTGYANTDYSLWPPFAPLWMLFLSCFVSCAGSTGGGIKMIRAIVLYKLVYRELIRSMHPNAIYPVKIGGETVPNHILFAVLSFAFIYTLSIIVMTLAMSFSGVDIVTAFSAVVASINNTGPGLGKVGPADNFGHLSDFQTWVCTIAMLLGRLEMFTLLVVVTPAFWRK